MQRKEFVFISSGVLPTLIIKIDSIKYYKNIIINIVSQKSYIKVRITDSNLFL